MYVFGFLDLNLGQELGGQLSQRWGFTKQTIALHCSYIINFAKSKIDEMQESGVSQTRTNSGQRNAIHCMELQVCRRIRIPEEYMAL